MKAAAPAQSLTFDWPRPEGFPFLLFGCVVVSFLAHAATFFLFQVSDPIRTSILPAAPQITVLTPSSPGAVAILRWIDAQDPALIATANSITPPGLFDIAYRPSYATMRTAPLGPVEQPKSVAFPSARDPLALIAAADAVPPPPPMASVLHPTAITFSKNLASRTHASFAPLIAKAHASEPLTTSRYLIGVTDQGRVRFVFLQDSSGNPILDDEAAAHFQTLAFSQSATPITWATVTVDWGAEAYAETPQSKIGNQESP